MLDARLEMESLQERGRRGAPYLLNIAHTDDSPGTEQSGTAARRPSPDDRRVSTPELILVAAIVLMLAVAPFLFARGHRRQLTETAAARAYLDGLFGPAPAAAPAKPDARRGP
jgi:hypothetical protein